MDFGAWVKAASGCLDGLCRVAFRFALLALLLAVAAFFLGTIVGCSSGSSGVARSPELAKNDGVGIAARSAGKSDFAPAPTPTPETYGEITPMTADEFAAWKAELLALKAELAKSKLEPTPDEISGPAESAPPPATSTPPPEPKPKPVEPMPTAPKVAPTAPRAAPVVRYAPTCRGPFCRLRRLIP